MKKIYKWRQIGMCGVDSGLLMLVDPCYVMAEDDRTLRPGKKTYSEMLGDLYKKDATGRRAHMILSDKAGDGVVFSTVWGDGVFYVEGRFYVDEQGLEVMDQVRVKLT